jgi:hypothetical protein
LYSGKTHGIGSVETVGYLHFTILFFNAMSDFQSFPERLAVFEFKPGTVFLAWLHNTVTPFFGFRFFYTALLAHRTFFAFDLTKHILQIGVPIFCRSFFDLHGQMAL